MFIILLSHFLCLFGFAADNPINSLPQTFFSTEAPFAKEYSLSKATDTGSWNFSGFIDFRYTFAHFSKDTFNPNDTLRSSFNIGDGALFGAYHYQQFKFLIDLPFFSKNSTDGYTHDIPMNTTYEIVFGKKKAQAFGQYHFNENLALVFGQFDTPLGYEANDTADRYFEIVGPIFINILPYTHTGVMLESMFNGFYQKLILASPFSKKYYGGNHDLPDKAVELSLILGQFFDHSKLQLGFFARHVQPENGRKEKFKFVSDLIYQINLERCTMGAEAIISIDPLENSLIPTKNQLLIPINFANILFTSYKISDPWSLAIRWEGFFSNFFRKSNPHKEENAFSVGSHFIPFPLLELRAEGTYKIYNYTRSIKEYFLTVAAIVRW